MTSIHSFSRHVYCALPLLITPRTRVHRYWYSLANHARTCSARGHTRHLRPPARRAVTETCSPLITPVVDARARARPLPKLEGVLSRTHTCTPRSKQQAQQATSAPPSRSPDAHAETRCSDREAPYIARQFGTSIQGHSSGACVC